MLKHMTLAEMTAVSGQMVDKTTRREKFLSIPEVAPLHRLLTDAHNAVLAAQPTDTQPSAAMLAILRQEADVDVRHDRLARASTLSLETEREHCLAASEPDEARAAMCERVSSQIFPDGLACNNVSYAAEAGNTARVAKLLHDQPQIGQFLDTISVPGKKNGNKNGAGSKKTLLDTIQEWIAVGRDLQNLEAVREDLAANEATPASPKTIFAARSQWIRIVNAVLNNLDLSTAPADTIEAIRAPIQGASDRAGKRYPTAATAKADNAESEPAETADNSAAAGGSTANSKADNSKSKAAAPPAQ